MDWINFKWLQPWSPLSAAPVPVGRRIPPSQREQKSGSGHKAVHCPRNTKGLPKKMTDRSLCKDYNWLAFPGVMRKNCFPFWSSLLPAVLPRIACSPGGPAKWNTEHTCPLRTEVEMPAAAAVHPLQTNPEGKVQVTLPIHQGGKKP